MRLNKNNYFLASYKIIFLEAYCAQFFLAFYSKLLDKISVTSFSNIAGTGQVYPSLFHVPAVISGKDVLLL